MSRMTCFNPTRALHDRRFRRKLSGWEFRDFCLLLWFAADECPNAAWIPAKKLADLAMELGMTGEKGKERLAQRLAKWSGPGVDLIEIEADGGIQINYLLDQEGEEAPAERLMPSASSGLPSGNGNGNGNGVYTNGTAPYSAGAPERRQNRQYSNTPEAQRKRDEYNRRKAEQNGEIYPPAEREVFETKREVLSENLTPLESKPHALAGGFGPKVSENLTQNSEALPEVSRARVGDVNYVSGGFKESYTSGDVTNVAPGENLRKTSGQNLTQSSPAGPAPPLPRPPLAEHQLPAARETDVRLVMRETGDNPKYKGQWIRLWKHCQAHDLLRSWDEGVAIFAWRIKVSPPSGPGSIKVPATWLRGTIMALLEKAGRPYVSAAQAEADGNGDGKAALPVDPVQAAEVHRLVAEIKAGWDAEARSAGVTPLEDVYDQADETRADEPPGRQRGEDE